MAYIDQYGTEFSEDRRTLIKFTSEISEYSIPNGTEEIAVNAFKDNQTLKVLHLPKTIKQIKSGALEKCKIEEIHFAGDAEQWLQITWDSFFNQAYKLYFNENTLVESIIIPDSISVIKSKAFYYCSSLNSIIFNKYITRIETSAFNKSGLKGILSIPKSCEEIGTYAFFSCNEITKVKIPESTKKIGPGAFSACSKLKSFIVSTDNRYFYTDGIGLYFDLNAPGAISFRPLRLIALASAYQELYVIHEDAISIGKDAFCYSSIPKEGILIKKTISVERGAVRNTKGKIMAPLKLRRIFLDQGLSAEYFFPRFVYKDALINNDYPEILVYNPFRILGVYCNASQKEIQSNATKIKRLLEINKQPTFTTDFNNIFGTLTRTTEMIDKALSQISQPKEKLAYALFWFTKPNGEKQCKAEELLKNTKIKEAIEIIINRTELNKTNLIPYYCLDKYDISFYNIIQYSSFIHHELIIKTIMGDNFKLNRFDKSLLEEICGNNFTISKEDCYFLFFDSLLSFLNPLHIWLCVVSMSFSKEIKEYIFNKSLGQNIKNINTQITSVNLIDKKDTSKLLKATIDLKQNTNEDISTIDEFLSSTDVRLITVHDALSKQILQSAIDSYNNADNLDSIARDIYSLMSYAKYLAKNNLLKKRCEDNMATVKKYIDKLPPEGLENADKKLFASVTRARNSADTLEQAKSLLKEAEPYLFKINLRYLISKDESREYNEKLRNLYRQGVRNGYENVREEIDIIRAKRDAAISIQSYFTNVSTIIANVCLNKLIEDVNSTSKNISKDAWPIITALNQLPLDEEFKKNRYYENVETLINYILPSGIKHDKDEISYDLIDLRPENIVWEESNKNNDFIHYIKRFPNGLHIKEAKELQEEIDRKNAEQRRLQEAENARKRLIKEAEQAKKAAEEEKRRQIEEEERARERQLEIEELYKQEKLERETKFLNWTIGVLVILIIFLLVYLFWGWAGIKTAFIIIGIILGLIVWGWITG